MEVRSTGLIEPGIIDSRIKLTVILFFCRHRAICEGVARLLEWLKESPWALEEALERLAESGLLRRSESPGGRRYVLSPNPRQAQLLEQLTTYYDDPARRDELYQQVRAAEDQRRCQEYFQQRSINIVHAGD